MTAKDIVRTTCPRDCYDSCGIAVIRRDGAITKVMGDADHPVSRGALCGKCSLAYNGAWRDPAARLGRPLRRTGAKGTGTFQPISWDDALAEIAAKLEAAVATNGPASVVHAHYTGTCSKLGYVFPLRFFHRLGATEVDPDTVCNNAGHVALGYVFGTSGLGFDPKTIRDSQCVVVWGANPSATAPHAHKHWLKSAPGPVIVIDPVRHDTAAAADLHLQLFPGSDAALAFAMAHVLLRDGMIDRAFIDAHTVGWDEVAPLIEAYTPARGEAATGVPAAAIEQAARLYGRGPSLLWLGQGLQRQPTGGNVMRAASLLPALTGNVGKPGTGILYVNGGGPRRIDDDYLEAAHLRDGPALKISHMDLADRLADPAQAAVFFCWNMNVAASGPRQAELRTALAREDLFSVVIDLFQTDTADYADIVLPAASFLEFDDLVTPYFHYYLSAQAKAAEPPGEALPNQEIFRRLAHAMGYTEPELFEDDRTVIDTLLERTGLGVGFDDLKARGTVDPWDEPRVPFADLRFPTPSGKIEIASAAAEADGHPRVPQPWADQRPHDGYLRLLSPASVWLMNDSYGNDPTVRERIGETTVYLHPADAEVRQLREGDAVAMTSAVGRLTARIGIGDLVPQGVALSHKGRWPRLEQQHFNVNVLNAGQRSDMGDSSAVHGIQVRLSKA
jgi:anaerobic selenocysteine-containing dehydrogenase